MNKRLILFELNEVPFRIFDHFAQSNPNSATARLLSSGRQFKSMTEDSGALSPWTTWPSLHRGVNDEKHLIGDFGQPLVDADRAYPPIWHLLADAGIKVGVGGSLHSYPLPKDLAPYAFYIPDVFASGPECFPESLNDFQQLCLSMARESAKNASRGVPWRQAISVLSGLPSLGITPSTIGKVAHQLAAERFAPWRTGRRRILQGTLAFDVFMKQLITTGPQFSTFFSNHVASALHRYWAAAFPADYETMNYSRQWINTYGGEIDFAMTQADAMLARLIAFVDQNPKYQLVVASSMGQHAIVANPLEQQVYINNPARFFARLGLEQADWQERPAMFAQYNFTVNEAAARRLEQEIPKVHIDRFALGYRRGADGFFSIDFGHANLPDCKVTYEGSVNSLEHWGLYNLEIVDKSGCSAYHIPEGSVIVYGGVDSSTAKANGANAGVTNPSAARPEISTLDLCPAILRNYSVPVPAYMRKSKAELVG